MNIEEKVLGAYKPKFKFLSFIIATTHGFRHNTNEALIDANYLSGLGYDGIVLKLTLRDDFTVDFDEVGTNLTTYEQRGRLLEVFYDKTLIRYAQKMVIKELPFKSVPQNPEDEQINLFLSVDFSKPIDNLDNLFDGVKVDDDSKNKLANFFGFMDDETETTPVKNQEVTKVATAQSEEKNVDINVHLQQAFEEERLKKLTELKNRFSVNEKEIRKLESEYSYLGKNIDLKKNDLALLKDRLESMQPIEPFNGYYFNVSERLNEKITLDADIEKKIFEVVSKLKSINADKFMKLFEAGEFNITLGIKDGDNVVKVTDYEALSDEIKTRLNRIGNINISDDKSKLSYVGVYEWGQLVNKLIAFGFYQDADFDKLCGSNSYINNEEDNTQNNLEDLKENIGYPLKDNFLSVPYKNLKVSKECVFGICETIDNKHTFAIETLDYWKRYNSITKGDYDLFLILRANGFQECGQGQYEYLGSLADAVKILCDIGIQPNIELQKYIASENLKLLTDTLKDNKYFFQGTVVVNNSVNTSFLEDLLNSEIIAKTQSIAALNNTNKIQENSEGNEDVKNLDNFEYISVELSSVKNDSGNVKTIAALSNPKFTTADFVQRYGKDLIFGYSMETEQFVIVPKNYWYMIQNLYTEYMSPYLIGIFSKYKISFMEETNNMGRFVRKDNSSNINMIHRLCKLGIYPSMELQHSLSVSETETEYVSEIVNLLGFGKHICK